MVNFEETTHTYTNDKGEQLTPTTTLLSLAGISPDYSCVKTSILKAKAERGNLIHKEIENYVKYNEFGFTKELASFVDYCNRNGIIPFLSELVVYNDTIAGTIDLVVKTKDGKVGIVDIKTTSVVYRKSVEWQTSIYRYLFEREYKIHIDFQHAWHFDEDGTINVVDLTPVSDSQVDQLIEWHKRNDGTRFQVELPEISQNDLQKIYDAEQLIVDINAQLKKAEEDANKIKQAVVNAMKNSGINRFENENIIINITPAHTKKQLDSDRLKTEHPKLYKRYQKDTDVKESVRITIRKNKKGNKND